MQLKDAHWKWLTPFYVLLGYAKERLGNKYFSQKRIKIVTAKCSRGINKTERGDVSPSRLNANQKFTPLFCVRKKQSIHDAIPERHPLH